MHFSVSGDRLIRDNDRRCGRYISISIVAEQCLSFYLWHTSVRLPQLSVVVCGLDSFPPHSSRNVSANSLLTLCRSSKKRASRLQISSGASQAIHVKLACKAFSHRLRHGNPWYHHSQHDRIGVAIVDNLRRNPQRLDASGHHAASFR